MSRGDGWSVVVTLLVTGAMYFVGGAKVAWACLVVGTLIGVGLHLTRPTKERTEFSDSQTVKIAAPENNVGVSRPIGNEVGNKRVYITRDFHGLLSEFDGKTTYESNLVVEKLYKGKWLAVEVTIHDICECAFGAGGLDFSGFITHGNKSIHVNLCFREPSGREVSHFKKGDSIKASGKIENLTARGIDLSSCEINA